MITAAQTFLCGAGDPCRRTRAHLRVIPLLLWVSLLPLPASALPAGLPGSLDGGAVRSTTIVLEQASDTAAARSSTSDTAAARSPTPDTAAARSSTPDTAAALGPARVLRVDSVFAPYDHTDSPGCALGVLQAGRLVYARGYGMADLDHGIAITPATVFRTGSVSKQFTAAVVVLLAREGAFSLDDDIRRYFPEIPSYERPITVRHLLHHTSGLRDYLELMAMRGVGDEATYTEEDVVKLLARQSALNFPPGSQFLYSNSGYVLLSRLVERATGRTLREEAERLLFEPLGMRHTHYHDNHREIVPQRAAGYGPAPGGGFQLDQTTLDIVGDGGVFTSIEDLFRWMANFWTLDVGGAAWLRTLETRGVLTNGDTLDYAMGLSHGVQRGIRYVGHGGAFVGYRAATRRYPEEGTAVMVLCNYSRTNPTELAARVGEIVLEDRMEPAEAKSLPSARAGTGETPQPPPPLSREERAAYTGTFHSEEVDATYRIYEGEEGLVVDVNGAEEVPLRPIGPDRFRAGFLTLIFEREGGNVTAFRAGSGRAGGVVFRRQRSPASRSSPAET